MVYFYLSTLTLGSIIAVLALGIFISMRIFDIPDITTDGSYTLGGAIAAVWLINQLPVGAVLIVAFAAGALAGAITGYLHSYLKVNALLAGILVMTALYSINLMLMGRSNLPLLQQTTLFQVITFLPSNVYTTLAWALAILLLLFMAIDYLLKTDFGLAMRATGVAETMMRANGTNTTLMKLFGLAFSNGIVALTGALIVQYQGFADINMGIGIVIVGLGSVMIGEAFSQVLRWNSLTMRLLGVVLGAILFRFILAFTLAIGIDPNWLKLITALIVLIVIIIPNLPQKK
ncbi:MAG: ABC transporter permease [Cytophagales bacterium]|nr:MAG: ABC transporter permease [Cytophagales bacterium]